MENWKISISRHFIEREYSSLTTKKVARKMLFPPCLIDHVPL